MEWKYRASGACSGVLRCEGLRSFYNGSQAANKESRLAAEHQIPGINSFRGRIGGYPKPDKQASNTVAGCTAYSPRPSPTGSGLEEKSKKTATGLNNFFLCAENISRE